MAHEDLPLFVLWEKVLAEILDRTGKFPKKARFAFSNRIDNLSLDVLEKIVEARYTQGRCKQPVLREIDLALARLRVLLRVSHDRRYLSTGGLELLAQRLDEAGRMVGGWRQQVERTS